jgi:hypothetical protein
LDHTLTAAFLDLLDHLPSSYFVSAEEIRRISNIGLEYLDSVPTVPLYEAFDDCGRAIYDFFTRVMYDPDIRAHNLIPDIRRQLLNNENAMNGLSMYERRSTIVPEAYERDEPPDKLCWLYFHDTPFIKLFNIRVPFVIPRDRWPTHALVLGPSEWGKSQLTGLFLREALEDPDPRAIILCDPHGDLYNEALTRIPSERLVAIDLTRNPPDLNILDHSFMPEREAIHTFRFLISSLAGGLTPKQEGCIRPLFALLKEIKDANLITLHEIISEPVTKSNKSKFASYFEKLTEPAPEICTGR